MAARIAKVYFDSDLRCNHRGLSVTAGIDYSEVKAGLLHVFINRRMTMAKILASNSTMLHIRGDGRLELTALQYLPRIFATTGRVDYTKALGLALAKRFR